MYGWVVDGLSSLFEPITGQKHSGWPGLNVGGEIDSQRQDSNARPTKRNYQSVHVSGNVSQSEPVAIKRRRKDIISFVKKTVAGVAGLLRLRDPLSPASERNRRYTASQGPVGLMGIDELHTSWMSSSDWKMEKPTVGGQRERGGLGLLQGASPPLRKHSGSVLGPGNPDRGRDGDEPQRRSLQLLPSRPTLGVGTGPPSSNLPPPTSNRTHRQCLAVEEALKESDKEHYRRLLEMVSDKYSKSQPLPFTRTKPQGATFTQDGHRMAILGRTYESVTPKTGPLRANPSVYMWRDTSSAKQTRDMRGELWLSKPLSAAVDTQPASNATQKQPELDLSAEVAARLNLVDREKPTHTDTLNSAEELPRFSKEMAVEVSRALSQRDPNLVLSSAFKLCITQRDLASLQEGSWLNDEVINFYLSLVMIHSSSAGQGLKVYSFSTFFFPKLHGGGHSAVKRWTKAVDLFQYDIILVPLHLGVHWSLAVINFNSRTVRSYDSMGQRHDDICNLLLLYLREEHKARKDRDLDAWTVGSLRPSEIPQQKNGSDCGVFACKYADYIAQGRPLNFRQCHMPLFRKLMIWEILNQRLL
ncbi:sentrin-specific protease 2 isoform X1 [Oncorhynchus mykiss]|uniref:sentrin-specific protease 2 isoform X1 n=2 Tax=Oncorhynchus mykiss TaxID=8022 RepID=UPI0018778C0F|nr:sentrin-specific protease 2 isoform X1 [Oncorhynchus mykiss]